MGPPIPVRSPPSALDSAAGVQLLSLDEDVLRDAAADGSGFQGTYGPGIQHAYLLFQNKLLLRL